ncbi:MAG: hypothetical protein AABY22_15365, partial [Nanoarchaeota archaeon]
MENKNLMFNKMGQVTVFIIIGILIVAAVVLIFTVGKQADIQEIDENLQPAYQNFLNCLEQDTRNGVDILGTQGGYIYTPEFEPGSSYMPFSSQLDFMGNGIPYWYYVSGNNIQKEQVPSKQKMEQDLGQFISEKIIECDFQDYYLDGFQVDINPENIKADVVVNNNNIDVDLNTELFISNGDSSAVVENHKITLNSKLGKFYNIGGDIYNYEQRNMFLEEYAVDTLRLYAPVDGVELSCAPKVWNAQQIVSDLQTAIEVNT